MIDHSGIKLSGRGEARQKKQSTKNKTLPSVTLLINKKGGKWMAVDFQRAGI